MPTLLLKFWPHILVAVVVIAIVGWFSHSRYTAGYEAAQAVMAEAVRKAEAATKAAEAKARAITEAKDREWQTERDQLQSRVTDLLSRPAPAIRLCKSTGRSNVPAVPDATGEHDDATGGGGSDLRMGEDIGSAALVLAGKCERDRRQLKALQAWVAEQAR